MLWQWRNLTVFGLNQGIPRHSIQERQDTGGGVGVGKGGWVGAKRGEGGLNFKSGPIGVLRRFKVFPLDFSKAQ